MTNILPPKAKKNIITEYWIRVLSTWIVIWSVCLLVGAIMLWPTHVLISAKTAAYAAASAKATERTEEYNTLGRSLVAATKQAEQIIVLSKRQSVTVVLEDIWAAAEGQSTAITLVSISKSNGIFQTVRVEGVAADRLALASFRSTLQELAYVEDVDLPLNDLASNEDIEFGLQVTVMNPSS